MGALSHIRVLDLSRVLAAPFATQILGDLGAEVIKIEKPGEGDETRAFGPPFLKAKNGEPGDATYFLTANRNKKSVAIDFAKPSGAELVRKLARRAHHTTRRYRRRLGYSLNLFGAKLTCFSQDDFLLATIELEHAGHFHRLA